MQLVLYGDLMTTRHDRVMTWRLPHDIALAQVFFWEVLLTDKWDHLFPKDLPLLPRQNRGFCPVLVKAYAGSQMLGDMKLVEFVDESFGGRFIIGMRLEKLNTHVSSWYPNSISGNMRIMLKEVAMRTGQESITIPPTKVEEKK